MLFETYLTNDDIKALSTGKMYDGLEDEYFETKRGLAILEDGYVDIELNICENYNGWENGKEIEPAYYICQKCVAAGMFEFWESVGYADEVLSIEECYPNIDWTGDYKKQLREDMERVLKLYVEKAGLHFDKPNKSLVMEEEDLKRINKEKKRRGRRPKTEGARRKEVRVRLTDEEFDRLTRYAEKSGRTKSDILRSAISEATTVNDSAWDDSHCRTPEERAAFFGDFMD